MPQPDPESEKQRKRITYKADEARDKERTLQEVSPEHYVFVTDEEAETLKITTLKRNNNRERGS